MNQERVDVCNEFPRDNLKNVGKGWEQIKKTIKQFFEDITLEMGAITILFTIVFFVNYMLTNFILSILIVTITLWTFSIFYFRKCYDKSIKDYAFLSPRKLSYKFAKIIYIFLEPLSLGVYYLTRKIYCKYGNQNKDFFKNILLGLSGLFGNILFDNLRYSASFRNHMWNSWIITFISMYFFSTVQNVAFFASIAIFTHSIIFFDYNMVNIFE